MGKKIWQSSVAEESEAPMESKKWPPVVDWSGDLGCLDYAAAVMFHLCSVLMPDDEKIRVTIERDPEAEQFTIKREVIT